MHPDLFTTALVFLTVVIPDGTAGKSVTLSQIASDELPPPVPLSSPSSSWLMVMTGTRIAIRMIIMPMSIESKMHRPGFLRRDRLRGESLRGTNDLRDRPKKLGTGAGTGTGTGSGIPAPGSPPGP